MKDSKKSKFWNARLDNSSIWVVLCSGPLELLGKHSSQKPIVSFPN